MEKLDPKELSQLLRKPQGDVGVVVGEEMNKSNDVMYDLVFSVMAFGDGERILEIGFGNGAFFSKYLEFNNTLLLHGLDYSESMCQEARKRNSELVTAGSLQVTHGDAASTGFADQSFDKIVALNTIYFWEPLEDYFTEIKRILKPGGILYIGFRPRHVVEHFEFTRHNFNLYEAEALKEIVEKCGLRLHEEKQMTYEKSSPEGHRFTSTDICLSFTR